MGRSLANWTDAKGNTYDYNGIMQAGSPDYKTPFTGTGSTFLDSITHPIETGTGSINHVLTGNTSGLSPVQQFQIGDAVVGGVVGGAAANSLFPAATTGTTAAANASIDPATGLAENAGTGGVGSPLWTSTGTAGGATAATTAAAANGWTPAAIAQAANAGTGALSLVYLATHKPSTTQSGGATPGGTTTGATTGGTVPGVNPPAPVNPAIADPFGPQRAQYGAMLSSLLNDPSTFLKTPYFTSQLQAGTDAINRAAGASGHIGSGNRLAELTSYGQNLAQKSLLDYANMLGGLAGSTIGNPGATTAANTNMYDAYTAAMTNTYNTNVNANTQANAQAATNANTQANYNIGLLNGINNFTGNLMSTYNTPNKVPTTQNGGV